MVFYFELISYYDLKFKELGIFRYKFLKERHLLFVFKDLQHVMFVNG